MRDAGNIGPEGDNMPEVRSIDDMASGKGSSLVLLR